MAMRMPCGSTTINLAALWVELRECTQEAMEEAGASTEDD
jgi:hypothetical protein